MATRLKHASWEDCGACWVQWPGTGPNGPIDVFVPTFSSRHTEERRTFLPISLRLPFGSRDMHGAVNGVYYARINHKTQIITKKRSLHIRIRSKGAVFEVGPLHQTGPVTTSLRPSFIRQACALQSNLSPLPFLLSAGFPDRYDLLRGSETNRSAARRSIKH